MTKTASYSPKMCFIKQKIVFFQTPARQAQLKEGGRIGAIFMEGALGVARIGYKMGTTITWRFSFNASAPVLLGFGKTLSFAL